MFGLNVSSPGESFTSESSPSEREMIHDFATVPRYVEPLVAVNKTGPINSNSPIQLRWLLIVVFLCSIVWFSFFYQNSPEFELMPDQASTDLIK